LRFSVKLNHPDLDHTQQRIVAWVQKNNEAGAVFFPHPTMRGYAQKMNF